MREVDLVRLYFADELVRLAVNPWFLVGLGLLMVAMVIGVARRQFKTLGELEIDEAELGIGSQKIKLRPNVQTAQIAYKLWVEISTRKVGLPIDFDHDVIAEVYDSWYEFFRVTRELLKEIPATQLRSNRSARQLTHLAIDVLNEGLRPHLTKWQARFRYWYEKELRRADLDVLEPQQLQQTFRSYRELQADMEAVNVKLIAYRSVMKQIVFGK